MKKTRVIFVIALVLMLIGTVVACNRNVEFKIVFEVDGQDYYEISTAGEEVITMPANPSKENYVFDGWYWDSGTWQRPFTAESLLSEKLSSDMRVYAKWVEEALVNKVFDVSFNTMGGSGVDNQKVKYNNLVSKPTEPTKADFLFAGWYKQPDYGTEWNFATDVVTDSTTIYAKWVPDIPENRKYTVAFNANGGSEVASYKDLAYNTLLTKPASPKKDGYAFVGWYFDNTYAKEWNFDLDKVTENLTLYARWVDDTDAKGSEIVEATGFEKDGFVLSIVVANSKDSLSLTNIISVSPWATWEVYKDKQGATTPIKTKNVDLKVGDNTYYVLVKSGMGPGTYENFYELKIRRREIYDVTFVYGNGEPNGVVQVEEDNLVVIDEGKTVSKIGYTFKGWQYGEDVWNLEEDIVTKEIGNMTLTAIWQPNDYAVTFDSSGGSDVSSIDVTYGAIYDFTVPERRGYDFQKWIYTVPATETESSEDVDLTDADGNGLSIWNIAYSITAKAVWAPVVYKIEYSELRGASNSNVTEYTIEDEITLVSLDKEGYTFNGWLDENNQKTEKIVLGSIGNRTFKADWSAIDYTATFRADGAEVKVEHFNMDEESVATPSIPEKVGYTSEWESFKLVPRDIVVNAVYTPIVYSITYQSVAGSYDVDTPVNNNAIEYTIESATIKLANASKTGYTFEGWTDEANEAVTEIAHGSYGNKVFTAHWTPISYTLIMVLENEDGEYEGHYETEENKTAFTVEDAFVFINPICDIKGYKFKGWYTTKNEYGEKVNGVALGTVGNRKYYAQWDRIEYTIAYYGTEEADNANPVTYNVDTDTFTLDDPVRVGHDFLGWFTDEAKSESANTTISNGTIGNLKFYAKWQLHVYTITYNLYDGKNATGNPDTYTYEDEVTLAKPTKTGYSFGGWFRNPEFTESYVKVVKGSHGNLTLYAKWYYVGTATFVTNGGSNIAPVTQEYGTKFSRPANPTKDYYIFENWYEDESLTKVYAFTTMPDKDFNLYAKWTPVVYDITYVLNNGKNGNNPDTYTADDEVIFEEATRIGYTFKGWFTDEKLTSAVVEKFVKGSHGDITLYAGFDINKYTLTFNSVGGTAVTAITQDYDTVVDKPADPFKTGYEFKGWYKDAAYKQAYTFARMQAEDLTLFAKWELVNYAIDYNLSGGKNNAQNPATYTIVDDTIKLNAPTKLGYTFEGWYKENSFVNVITEIPTGSYGVVSVHAKWQVITYDITYIGIDGLDNPNPDTYTVEDAITFAEIAKKGYTFDGLFTSSTYAKQVTEIKQGSVDGITLYAKYTVNDYIIYVDGKESIDYVVSFNLNGADGSIASQTLGEGVALTYPTAPARQGYVFGGWFVTEDCEGEAYDFSAQIKNNITLYAKWISTTNAVINVGDSVNVTINGREYFAYDFVPLVSGNVTIYTTGDVDTFGHLYNGDGVELKRNDSASDTNENFTIVYNVTAGEKYTVKFRGYGKADKGASVFGINGSNTVIDGGTAVYGGGTVDVTFDENFTMPIPDEREGYVFRGYADIDGTMYTDALGSSIKVWDKDEDAVLYSSWDVDGFTVTFVTNGGTAVEEVTLPRGSRLNINNYVTTQSGKSFVGWYLSASDAESYNATVMPDYNITLYAKWTTYALRTVKYDASITYVSEFETITADTFGATCFDTDGNMIDVTATASGTQTAGNTLTVRLVAKGLNNKTKSATLQNIAVYGNPTLNCADSVTYVNVKDGLKATWFSASGTDTYGNALTVKFTVTDEDGNEGTTLANLAGKTVTIKVYVEDITGNVTAESIENVKVYGYPTIDSGTKRDMKDTESVTAALLGISAVDSFGVSITPTVTISEGTKAASNTIKVKIYAKDSHGNANTAYISVKVYGTPVISNQTTTDFKVEDEITVESLGLTARDSFGKDLDITLELTSGTQEAGATLTYKATVSDHLGNVATRTYTAKIYGAPVVTYSRTEIKVGEDVVGNPSANLLKAKAEDSFGSALAIEYALVNGNYMSAGTYVTYTVTALDHLGNKTTVTTEPIGVYGTPTLTYDAFSADMIKLDSKGEEFSATAADSFGESVLTTIERADGGKITAGKAQDIVIVATDKTGNRKVSETISSIKVYGVPTVTYAHEYYYVTADEDVTFMFTAYDSFGDEVYADVTVLGATDNVTTVRVEATDDAGNTFTQDYDICTAHTLNANCVCTVCHKTLHEFSNWCTSKSPTCTEAGSKYRTCSNCNKKETQTVEALGHTLDANCVCTRYAERLRTPLMRTVYARYAERLRTEQKTGTIAVMVAPSTLAHTLKQR